MKILRSYVCRPSEVVGVVLSEGILKFTMSGTGCWKRYEWGVAGPATFIQQSRVIEESFVEIEQTLLVDVERDEFVFVLTAFNDICDVYAAHFAEDGRVFFQGFEAVGYTDRALTRLTKMGARGKYCACRAVGAGTCSAGVFSIVGRSYSLATIIAAENAAKQEQFLNSV